MYIAIAILLLIVIVWYWGWKTPNRDDMVSHCEEASRYIQLREFGVVAPNETKHPLLLILGSVHGNEPAGHWTMQLLASSLQSNSQRYEKVQIVMLQGLNQWGLERNKRESAPWSSDINRAFGDTAYGNNAPCPQVIAAIRQQVERARAAMLQGRPVLIIDLHEGWGFHHVQPSSLGSTLSPSGPTALAIAQRAHQRLNSNINSSTQQWTILADSNCDERAALGCMVQNMAIPYILVETTGQNDIQPLTTRVKQQMTVIVTAMEYLGGK
jgi:predicted deacylase